MRSPKRTILLASLTLALTAGSGAAIAATHNSTPAKPTTSTATTTSSAPTTTTPSTTTPSTTTPKSSTPKSTTDNCPHSSSTSAGTSY